MRIRLPSVLIIAALMAAGPAASPAGAAEPAKAPTDQTVPLSPVALPIVEGGHVVNYVFVNVRILLSPAADAFALRDKEPFFRDALVRAAYRTPFQAGANLNRIDEARLKSVLLHEAAAIAGPGKVVGIAVDNQTPQHFLAPQGPAAAAPGRDAP
jgi:hypothetical protein